MTEAVAVVPALVVGVTPPGGCQLLDGAVQVGQRSRLVLDGRDRTGRADQLDAGDPVANARLADESGDLSGDVLVAELRGKFE